MEEMEKIDYVKELVENKVAEMVNIGLVLGLTKEQVLLMFQNKVNSYNDNFTTL